jgi:hypothetical protein
VVVWQLTTALPTWSFKAKTGQGLILLGKMLWPVPDNPRDEFRLLGAIPPMIVRLFLLLLLCLGLLAWRLGPALRPLLRFTSEDDAAPPRLWTAVAILLVAFQAFTAVTYTRPDWDDGYNLGAALDYLEGPQLNDQEPTHREGFPVQAIHRVLCWELWGATLSFCSGFHPLVVFHTLLPGLVVLLAYGAYTALFAEFLPRRWVPLAILGLSGYFLFGISSLEGAENHFLVRPWQGKAVLLHVALPLTAVVLCRFAARPTWGWWLSLLACVAFGLGVSSSAIFLLVGLVGCLSLALLPTMRTGHLRFLVGSALALAPLAIEGLGIRAEVQKNEIFTQQGIGQPLDQWFHLLLVYGSRGCVEIIWLVCLPLLAVLLGDWRRRAYPVSFAGLVLLTVGNPFLAIYVAQHLTSPMAYYRSFWWYPVGVGIGALLALLARLVGRAAALIPSLNMVHLPLAVGIGTLAAFGFLVGRVLPGTYVWGRDNNLGPFMTPRLAENLEKMPADVLAIARQLAADPDAHEGLILCPEEIGPYLMAYSRDFRFVTSRLMYTVYHFNRAGRPTEAIERYYLGSALKRYDFFPKLQQADWEFLTIYCGEPTVQQWYRSPDQPSYQDFGRLLDRYQVRYVVTSPARQIEMGSAQDEATRSQIRAYRDQFLKTVEREWPAHGYRPVYRGSPVSEFDEVDGRTVSLGEYILWKRDASTGSPRSQADSGPKPPPKEIASP